MDVQLELRSLSPSGKGGGGRIIVLEVACRLRRRWASKELV